MGRVATVCAERWFGLNTASSGPRLAPPLMPSVKQLMKQGRGGVEYEDVEVGSGSTADRGCTVELEYSLFLSRGDCVHEKQKYSFQIGQRWVIAGLEYGVEGMRAGSKRRIRVGPHLAYRLVTMYQYRCSSKR